MFVKHEINPVPEVVMESEKSLEKFIRRFHGAVKHGNEDVLMPLMGQIRGYRFEDRKDSPWAVNVVREVPAGVRRSLIRGLKDVVRLASAAEHGDPRRILSRNMPHAAWTRLEARAMKGLALPMLCELAKHDAANRDMAPNIYHSLGYNVHRREIEVERVGDVVTVAFNDGRKKPYHGAFSLKNVPVTVTEVAMPMQMAASASTPVQQVAGTSAPQPPPMPHSAPAMA